MQPVSMTMAKTLKRRFCMKVIMQGKQNPHKILAESQRLLCLGLIGSCRYLKLDQGLKAADKPYIGFVALSWNFSFDSNARER